MLAAASRVLENILLGSVAWCLDNRNAKCSLKGIRGGRTPTYGFRLANRGKFHQ